MTSTYAVYDVETTTRSPIGFPASPFWPDNRQVLGGWKDSDGEEVRYTAGWMFPETKVIVGANIKFDLLWAARIRNTRPAEIVHGARVWDVCLAHYLLQRQRVRMPSLDDIAKYYKLTSHKGNAVSAQIKAGVCPSKIDPLELAKYHTADLDLTEQVFLKQFEEATERNMLPLIWSQMMGLVATCEMEYNGMRIDQPTIEVLANHYTTMLDRLRVAFKGILALAASGGNSAACLEATDADTIMQSGKQLSFLFFGGKHKWTTREKVGVFKNGKDKYKNIENVTEVDGICAIPPKSIGAELNGNGYYNLDEGVLKHIVKEAGVLRVDGQAAEIILQHRLASKQLHTYVDGIRGATWPDGKVHTNFHHTVTKTGRLSSSGPNLQNIDGGGIKKVFIPHCLGWEFVEFDYSQLEVVGLAVLSKDEQLLQDIRDGIDIHTALYEDMYGRTPTASQRKAFKPLTFGLIYGAGVNTLADNAGCSRSDALKFVTVFYRRYTGVKKYHDEIQEKALHSRWPSAAKTEKGMPRGKYIHRTFTGREYEFLEYDNEFAYKKMPTSFSPTELKNWPIQGFSTGDVVPLMLGYVVDQLVQSPYWKDCLPVCTVHDSLTFEVRSERRDEIIPYLKELMSKTREQIELRFGVDVGVDFLTEAQCGRNWKEMEPC